MDRVMVNITWKCNLGNCVYCWVNAVVRCNSELWGVPNTPAQEWVTGLNSLDPAVFDFVGGEPLAFLGFSDVLSGLAGKHCYAVTSNLHHEDGVRAFIKRNTVSKCVHFTGSYHPSGKLSVSEFAARLHAIRCGGVNTSINIVSHESVPQAHQLADTFRRDFRFPVAVSPYEHSADLEIPNEMTLSCEAGRTHYVIVNNGDVYPCLSWFRCSGRAHRKMGNIFDGTFRKLLERIRCPLKCEMYYVVDPGNSMIAGLGIREEPNE